MRNLDIQIGPVGNSSETPDQPSAFQPSTSTDSAVISGSPTDPESSTATVSLAISGSDSGSESSTATESPITSGSPTATDSPIPSTSSISFGSPSLLRVPGVLDLPALPDSPLRPQFSPPSDFYPSREFSSESTLLESPEFPEISFSYCPEIFSPATPSILEDEKFDFLKWRLQIELECLMCTEIMVPPITVCKNGHMICCDCRPKLLRCPLCRDDITRKRNIFAEEVSRFLKIMCKYATQGCRVYNHPDKMSEHEVLCQYQPVHCLAGYGRQEVMKCGWKGRKYELSAHVSKKHGRTMVLKSHPITHTIPWIHEVDYTQVTLVCAHEDLFWLTSKCDVKARKRFEALQYIGPATCAKKFCYRCDLLSVDKKTGLSFFSTVRSALEDVENIFTFKPHFQIDIDVFKRDFADKDGCVPGYTLTIDKC